MPRGTTETTRATQDYREQSYIAKRNATPAELATAQQKYTDQLVTLPGVPGQRWRCTCVRLDSNRRLIFDLVREDLHPKGESADAASA